MFDEFDAYYFDDWASPDGTGWTGEDVSFDPGFSFGPEMSQLIGSTFDQSWAGPVGSGIMNFSSPWGGQESIRYDAAGLPAQYLSDNNTWQNYPGAGSGAADLAALKDPWALGAGALAGAMDMLQKQKYYKMMEAKMKQDKAWEEEQRRRQRQKQAEADAINQRDPAGVANIGSIVQNRGTYSGYGAPTDYGRVGGTAPRRMFAAEGGRAELPGGYKPGPLNFLRYLMAGRRFPWEQETQAMPVVERLQEYGSGQQRRRRLDEAEEQAVQGRAKGGALGHLRGPSKGQSDQIPAMLSDGEYVMDADSVSALGDGNNEAGAVALDQMRMNLRKHKRAAPPGKIPPKAKRPEAYLKKEK